MTFLRIDDPGPYDIIGDVHGCSSELVELIEQLGYLAVRGELRAPIESAVDLEHPDGRHLVFVGDLVDRGPDVVGVLRLLMPLVASGRALSVVGNHDDKLRRALIGRNVQVKHGLAESLAQLEHETQGFRDRVRDFLASLPGHLILDRGRLVVVHAGLPERMHGDRSHRARDFAMFGATTGKSDEYGLPVRLNWAASYRGSAAVVYGHTPVVEPVWLNGTIDIDTGGVFGGSLTALRWPERTWLSVAARRVYTAKGGPWRRVGPGGDVVLDEEAPTTARAG